MKIMITTTMVLLLVACNLKHESQLKSPSNSRNQLQQLVKMMSGEFSSLKQSQENDQYFNISLKMKPIWHESTEDGYWLYVEQAVGNMLDKPYRQRIYHLTQLDEQTFSSEVYELPDASAAIGAYENPALLAAVSFQELVLRTGCAVILKQVSADSFKGSTRDKTCLSELRGATYANSIVVITPESISSWDQGFDNNEQQVWGAVEGPYVFDRK